MTDDFPNSPDGWANRSDHFLEVAQKPENAGLFNLGDAGLTQWHDENDELKGFLHEREVLQDRLTGVNAQIKVQGAKVEGTARAGLGTASKSPASDQLKAQAGVTIARDTTHPAPIAPTKLVATVDENGVAKLKWDRADNIPSAKFIVEKLIGEVWTMQNIVTAVSALLACKVGEPASFRVRARNGQGDSEPSNVAVIYSN